MDNTYQKLLVAVDGSVNSEIALKEAIKIAKKTGADLFLLQVINTRGDLFSNLVIESEREDAEAYLNSLKEQAANEGFEKLHLLLEEGGSKELIARDIPAREDIDLIIIGATGKHGIERVLGSTTHYVVSHAECNVLVVK